MFRLRTHHTSLVSLSCLYARDVLSSPQRSEDVQNHLQYNSQHLFSAPFLPHCFMRRDDLLILCFPFILRIFLLLFILIFFVGPGCSGCGDDEADDDGDGDGEGGKGEEEGVPRLVLALPVSG